MYFYHLPRFRLFKARQSGCTVSEAIISRSRKNRKKKKSVKNEKNRFLVSLEGRLSGRLSNTSETMLKIVVWLKIALRWEKMRNRGKPAKGEEKPRNRIKNRE